MGNVVFPQIPLLNRIINLWTDGFNKSIYQRLANKQYLHWRLVQKHFKWAQNGKPTITVVSGGVQREALLTLAVEAAGGVEAGGAGAANVRLIAAFVVVYEMKHGGNFSSKWPAQLFRLWARHVSGRFEFISLTYACRLVLCEAWGAFTGEATDRVDAQELTVVLLGWALVQIWDEISSFSY